MPLADNKICTRCRRYLPITEFFLNRSKDARTVCRHSRCKNCRREQCRLWSKTQQGKRVKRAGVISRTYGMSETEYFALAESQDFVCAICSLPETKTHRDGSLLQLSVDHDHQTGVVRGLLCQACNVGLGCFRDNSNHMRNAATYVESSQIGQAKKHDGETSPLTEAARKGFGGGFGV